MVSNPPVIPSPDSSHHASPEDERDPGGAFYGALSDSPGLVSAVPTSAADDRISSPTSLSSDIRGLQDSSTGSSDGLFQLSKDDDEEEGLLASHLPRGMRAEGERDRIAVLDASVVYPLTVGSPCLMLITAGVGV